MAPLVKRLKIITRSQAQVEYELQHARLTAIRSADSRLDRMHNDGMLSSHTWEKLKRSLTSQAAELAEKVRGMLLADPVLETEELETGWREMLRAQRSALFSLRQDGVISDDVFEQLSTEVDAQLSEGFSALPDESETRTQFLELTLSNDSVAVGKSIAELNVPRSAVLVSIQRGEEIIIPRGDTILQVGDVVTTLCERDTVASLKQILSEENGKSSMNYPKQD
jgi:ribosomal protein L19E